MQAQKPAPRPTLRIAHAKQCLSAVGQTPTEAKAFVVGQIETEQAQTSIPACKQVFAHRCGLRIRCREVSRQFLGAHTIKAHFATTAQIATRHDEFAFHDDETSVGQGTECRYAVEVGAHALGRCGSIDAVRHAVRQRARWREGEQLDDGARCVAVVRNCRHRRRRGARRFLGGGPQQRMVDRIGEGFETAVGAHGLAVHVGGHKKTVARGKAVGAVGADLLCGFVGNPNALCLGLERHALVVGCGTPGREGRVAAESFVGHAHNGTGQGVLLDVPDMKSGGTVFVADHGETIFAQGGDAAEVVGGDAPMGQAHATKHIGLPRRSGQAEQQPHDRHEQVADGG